MITPPPMPSPDEYDPPAGYSFIGDRPVLVNYRLPVPLKMRLNGAVRFAWDSPDPVLSQITSQSGLVRIALDAYLASLEAELNDGLPFTAPEKIVHRRGLNRTGPWVKAGVYLPSSLIGRVQGAAEHCWTHGVHPEASNANQLVVTALQGVDPTDPTKPLGYLTQMEKDFNRGKPFTSTRRAMPAGRPLSQPRL